jgi:hypothetical protein
MLRQLLLQHLMLVVFSNCQQCSRMAIAVMWQQAMQLALSQLPQQSAVLQVQRKCRVATRHQSSSSASSS